ncbi:hypothetical protein Tfer_0865 [Thermincola ferriacetica]|uniref:Uncharacterized protein n=1 Tax=Thermincola ferriacetica TaxID=281456 RepID=A0A0L6W445_9FIRM|nr:hypothetical protein [Thermincola ferriacetica]KNZ70305.1 hypothetical protein Tfer_0865 [Thermincola ferriacetica]
MPKMLEIVVHNYLNLVFVETSDGITILRFCNIDPEEIQSLMAGLWVEYRREGYPMVLIGK